MENSKKNTEKDNSRKTIGERQQEKKTVGESSEPQVSNNLCFQLGTSALKRKAFEKAYNKLTVKELQIHTGDFVSNCQLPQV